MSKDDEKEWDPSKESVSEELQQRLLARLKKEDEAAEAAARAPAAPASDYIKPIPPPTLEETKERIKKAWGLTKELVPDAPDQVKSMTFQWMVDCLGPYYRGM